MVLSRKSNQLLARVNFPPYTVHCITERHVLVAGGGGGAKTGVPNIIEIYELNCDSKGYKAKSVAHFQTGQHAIMNSTVFDAGRYFMVFAGMDEMCQLYKVKFKMEKTNRIPNGFVNEESVNKTVRQRKKSKSEADEQNDETPNTINNGGPSDPVNILLDLKPIQSFQTDYSSDPFQKVVKFSASSKILATGGSDGFLRVWGYPDLNKIHEIEAHSKDVDDIDFTPSGDKIITVSRDGLGKIWDSKSGELICSLEYEIPTKTEQKYIFRNCRFSTIEGNKDKLVLFISLNPAIRKRPPSQCCLTKWDGQNYAMEKLEFVGTEMLSTMAVSDDGCFIGLGTQEGSVRIYIAFSLQLLYRVDHVHSIFVTGLDFMKPCKISRQITGGYEAALISISVDNHINVHCIPHRPTIGLYTLVILFILMLFMLFIIMDYFNL